MGISDLSSTLKYPGSNVNSGVWAEFRDNKPIPSNNDRRAEIQCISDPPSVIIGDGDGNINDWVNNNRENFYVD